jgi:hypothetical protein
MAAPGVTVDAPADPFAGLPHTADAYVNQSPDDPAEQETGRPTFRQRLLTLDQLGGLPQPAPLVEDTLDMRTVAVLSGRRGRGKSLLALDWACSIASGKTWQNRAVRQGGVLWVAAEGAYGMKQRTDAWEYAWRCRPTALTTFPAAVNLFSGRHFAELVAYIEQAGDILVVFDTWARCTVGGKENDNSDATLALERLERLRHLGATSLVVAHTDAEDTKTRGATALEDNVDTVYRLKGDAEHLILTRTKRKDGPEHDELHLRLRPTLDSVVVESASAVDIAGRAADLMSIFTEHFADTGASKAELRAVAAEAGITSSGTFSRGVNTLVSTGALIQTGTDARPFYKAGAGHVA